MPMSTTLARGNVGFEAVLQVSISPPASLAANSTTEVLYTIPGIVVGDFLEINKPSHTAGLSIGNIRASATNQIGIQWVNSTTSTITSAINELYLIAVTRFDSVPNTPPAAIA